MSSINASFHKVASNNYAASAVTRNHLFAHYHHTMCSNRSVAVTFFYN